MMKKIIVLLLVVFGFSNMGLAQEEAQFTQFMFNRLSYNPAYAGSSGSICAMVLYRNQWLGLSLDAPSSDVDAGSTPTDYLFAFDMPVKFLHGGIGISATMDEVGYHKNVSASIDYAFRMFWGSGNLAAAIELNLFNSTFDMSQLHGIDDLSGNYNDPIASSGDPFFSSGKEESDFMIDLSTGLYYQVPGLWYLGVSVKNLLASHSDVINYQNARLVYAMGGYDYTLPFNPSFKLKLSGLAKTANFSIFQADIAALIDYRSLLWGGLSFRTTDAVAILGGVNWNKLQFGLSYDLTVSQLGTYKRGRSQGTLEAYLRYCFKVIIPQKAPSVYRNTRYLF